MMELENLTTRSIYNYITLYIDKNKIPPTLREISAACYVSKSNVQIHLSKLEGKGLIEVKENTARGIILLPQPTNIP